MMQEESRLIHSPLQQTYSTDGKSIDDLPETGWTVEAVDEHGNSTVWDGEFANDQDAFDEVMKTIQKDGIESLIGQASKQSSSGSFLG